MSIRDDTLDRREAIQRIGLLFGGVAFAGGNRLLAALEGDAHGRAALVAHSAAGVGEFSAADVALLDEVADTILPATSTPGAKAARTGAFMALMVTDTYDPGDRQIFRDGMRAIDNASRTEAGTTFVKATARQRLTLLQRLDREAKQYMDSRGASAPTHSFRMMKELTLLGYFTSEIGCTQAQRYVESPGRFDPCVPYGKGERSWAGHA